MMTQQRSRAGSAALWGVLIGVLLAVVIVLGLSALTTGAVLPGNAPLRRVLISSGVVLAVVGALYFVAGVLAGRRAQVIEAGLFAGLIAGLIVGVTIFALSLLTLASLRTPAAGEPLRQLIRQGLARAAFARAAVGLLLQMAIGSGLGALGGLVGRGRGGAPAAAPSATSSPPHTPPSSPFP